jgi:hypothetical protein
MTQPGSPEAPSVHWSVVAGGGGQSSLGSFTLQGTIGQSCVGRTSLGSGSLIAGFWQDFGSYAPYCCESRVGDANGLGGDEPTLGDIALMIDAKFISLTCDGLIDCLSEADINQSGGQEPTCDDITIGDISILVDYLFISGPYDPTENPSGLTLPDCL